MPHITVRRSSTQRSVLASLLVLTVSAVLVLAGTPGYAFPTADEDMSFSISSDIVVKDEDTFSVKLTMSESESVPVLSESVCDKGSPDSSNSSIKDLKVNFKSENGTRTCTMEGTGSITSSSKNVRHKGDEFIVQTLNFDDFPSGVSADVTQSVTFPGKVTEADGGTVEGTKVSFNDNDQHEVKGKDKPAKSAATGSSQDAAGEDDSGSIPVWVWRLIGSLAVAIVGGVAGMLVMMQRKKKQSQLAAYTAAAQVYDPTRHSPDSQCSSPTSPVMPSPPPSPTSPATPSPTSRASRRRSPTNQGSSPTSPATPSPTSSPTTTSRASPARGSKEPPRRMVTPHSSRARSHH